MRWPWSSRAGYAVRLHRDPVEIRIGESFHVHYRYHLYRHGDGWKALCGAEVMDRNLTDLTLWGFKSHLNERYCDTCAKAGTAMGLKLGE